MEMLPYVIYVCVIQLLVPFVYCQKEDVNTELTTIITEEDISTDYPYLFNDSVSYFDINGTNGTDYDWENGTEGEGEDDASPTTLMPPLSNDTTDPTLPEIDNGLILEDFCLCDLKIDACDVNCCCDADCDKMDRKVFSHCMQRPDPVLDLKYCFQERLLFSNRTEYIVEFTHPGAFCIVTDNLPQRTTYSLVKGVSNLEDYNDLIENKRKKVYSWLSNEGALSVSSFESYSDGSNLWAVDNQGGIFTLDIPTSVISSECETTSPLLFLRDTESSCLPVVQDIAVDCLSNVYLDAHYYLRFAVIADPGNIFQNETTETTVGTEVPVSITTESSAKGTTLTDSVGESTETTTGSPIRNNTRESLQINRISSGFKIEGDNDISLLVEAVSVRPFLCILDNGNEICNEKIIGDIPKPEYVDGQCMNVLRSVSYIFSHNGSEGIYDFQAKIYLHNLSSTWSQARQTFSVKYMWASSDENMAERSGRPGYIRGRPLLMGKIVENVTEISGEDVIKEAVILSTNPNDWFWILTAGSGGECNTSAQVDFGIDLSAGCLLEVTEDDFNQECRHLQDRILELLLSVGSISLNDAKGRIASYGDSHVNNIVDWVPLLVAEEPQCDTFDNFIGSNTRGKVFSLITSLHIEVAYSLQGSLANPQSKIVGVRIQYGQPQEIDSPCMSSVCGSGSGDKAIRKLELRSSVSFVDVSLPPIPAYSQPPALDVKLPYDFFYPFLPSASCCNCYSTICLVICAFLLHFYRFLY